MLVDKRTLLEGSWERSRQYGVDQQRHPEDILDSTTLKKYKEASFLFLTEMEPTVHRLCGWLQLQQSVVVVSGADGYILESIGDPSFIADAEKIQLKPGAGWSEQVRGTNAIGTVLLERKPLAILGEEHYCMANRFLYCAASPIFNPQGEILAVLDVSGFHKDYHPSLLGMVDVIARQIEDGILARQAEGQVVLEFMPEKSRNSRALFILSEDGVITGMNREARSIFERWTVASTGHIELPQELSNVKTLLKRSTIDASSRSVMVCSERLPDETWVASVYLDKRPALVSYATHAKPKANAPAKPDSGVHYTFDQIFAEDPRMRTTLQLAMRAATTDYNVLVTGESGTGKEMVSQAIHAASPRRDMAFVAINCGAIPKTLMESELFGYEAGSFTGAANTARPGKVELAHGGTLFLDEIAEMPYDMQVALLRVLQERTITRIGGHRPIHVDVRIIAATNKDLFHEVEQNRFRADLYFRLLGIQVELMPLRARQDRVQLAEYLLEGISRETGRTGLTLSPRATKLISAYHFPGNVRELAAILRHAAFLSTTHVLDVADFPAHVFTSGLGLTEPEVLQPGLPTPLYSLRELEYGAILDALNSANGNMTKAARILGISRNTLYRRLKARPEQLI